MSTCVGQRRGRKKKKAPNKVGWSVRCRVQLGARLRPQKEKNKAAGCWRGIRFPISICSGGLDSPARIHEDVGSFGGCRADDGHQQQDVSAPIIIVAQRARRRSDARPIEEKPRVGFGLHAGEFERPLPSNLTIACSSHVRVVRGLAFKLSPSVRAARETRYSSKPMKTHVCIGGNTTKCQTFGCDLQQ